MTFVIKNTASQHCPIRRTHQMNNDHPACVGKLPLSLSSARYVLGPRLAHLIPLCMVLIDSKPVQYVLARMSDDTLLMSGLCLQAFGRRRSTDSDNGGGPVLSVRRFPVSLGTHPWSLFSYRVLRSGSAFLWRWHINMHYSMPMLHTSSHPHSPSNVAIR